VVDVDVKRGDVAWFESLNERLGGEGTATARARLDACCLVDLVAKRGHLGASRTAGR